MARKKKDSAQQLKVTDIVVLWSKVGLEGEIIGSGTVERIQPMHGNPDQDMVWVTGFAPHHPDAVERIGAPYELLGKLRVLENSLEQREAEVESLKKDLTTTKDRLESAVKLMDKTTAMLVIVDGNEHLDAKAAGKWIKDAKTKFNLSPIKEIGQRPAPAPRKADDPQKDEE